MCSNVHEECVGRIYGISKKASFTFNMLLITMILEISHDDINVVQNRYVR